MKDTGGQPSVQIHGQPRNKPRDSAAIHVPRKLQPFPIESLCEKSISTSKLSSEDCVVTFSICTFANLYNLQLFASSSPFPGREFPIHFNSVQTLSQTFDQCLQ